LSFFSALALAVGGGAGDEKILGKDDLEFAQALSRHGYPDLAEEILNALERSSSRGGAGGALRANVLRLALQEDEAKREPDLAKRGELLAAVVDAKAQFAASHPGTPEGDDVTNSLPDLYREIGELTAQALQKTEDPAEKTKLRESGNTMFTRAVEAIQTRMKTLEERKAKTPAPDPSLDPDDPAAQPSPEYLEVRRQSMIALYNLARTYYFHSLLFEPESYMKTSRIDSALAALQELQLEYSDQVLCYEGYIYEGLCHKEVGDLDKAISAFDFAISLRDSYERANTGVYGITEESSADVISIAVQQKMLVLAQKNDHAGAAATAKDFFQTIPDAYKTLKGLAVLALQADAYKNLGDQKELENAARKLIELDPRGPGGEKGREFLGGGGGSGGGSLSAADTMRLAESSAGRGDSARAISLCQDVMILARGSSEEANLGSKAGLLLGALFAQRNQLHEAAVAWDAAADRYPKGKDAPECMWRAINCYLSLQAQEQRSYYKVKSRDRMKDLASRYPDLHYGSQAAIIEGQQLEADGDFARAAATYESITAGTAAYEQSLYRAGNAWSRQARKQFQDGKSSDAKATAQKSEELLLKARAALDEAALRTLDIGQQNQLRGYSFNTRVSLANLYLMKEVGRAKDVLPLLEGIEQEIGTDPAKISTVINLRFKAYQALGKIDEAISLFDTQVRSDPKARWIGAAAGTLARALDTRGAELAQKGGTRGEIDDLWRKATDYYLLAVRGQLDGSEPMNVDDLEKIGDRLYGLALHFSGVPQDVESFVSWSGGRVDTALLEQVLKIYEALLPQTHSYRTLIQLARTQGFLGHWKEAASRYSELFESENFYNAGLESINVETLRAKPELIFAFLEWACCEREAGIKENDSTRLTRASSLFTAMVKQTTQGTALNWQSRYYQIQTLMDQGNYEVADIALRGIERATPEFDKGEFGLKDKFKKQREELSKKVFK
jgi:tetratricopeptide (TPR) repeat protein